MDILTLETGIAAIVAAIVGTTASLFAPWANWKVEKRKNKLRARKGFIKGCRLIIDKQRFSPDMFRETSHYSSLKIHLSDKLNRDIVRKKYPPGTRMDIEHRKKVTMEEFRIKKELFNEISNLERKWGLI